MLCQVFLNKLLNAGRPLLRCRLRCPRSSSLNPVKSFFESCSTTAIPSMTRYSHGIDRIHH